MRFSPTNLAATGIWSGSHDNLAYPSTNMATPEDPRMPAKMTVGTAASGTCWWQVDLGSSKTPPWMSLRRCNFATVTIQGDNDFSFGSPDVTFSPTITQNPFHGRYDHALLLTGINCRHIRIKPTGAVISDDVPAGTPSTVYRCGGAWISSPVDVITPPTYFPKDFAHEIIYPVIDRGPSHRGWITRIRMGDPRVRLTYDREAFFTHATPYLADDARTWLLSIDRAAFGVDVFALWEDPLNNAGGNNSLVWIVRDTFGQARHSVNATQVVSRSWEMEEVMR